MTTQDCYQRNTCRMCESGALQKVMALTPTPSGNTFLKEDELSLPRQSYPLDLVLCSDCHHVQLGHVVDPAILYRRDYPYVSATGVKFVAHLREYAGDMIRRFDLKPRSLVADIGSNDGTCLRNFKDAGMTVVGVDPATDIARRADASGIPTVGEFFSGELAKRLREQHGPAAFVTSHNACAHIDDLDDVMRGVRHWLAEDGLFVVEVGYLLDVYQNTWFDTIYHEHLDYHTVAPFEKLLARTGLELVGVERVSPQGGSIRLFIQRAGGPRQVDGSVAALIALERDNKLDRPETYGEWGRRIDAVGAQLRRVIHDLKACGKSIAGYGAPTKSTTLLSHFRLGNQELDFIVDDNPLKQGLFSPAAPIQIVPPTELSRRRPDYLLILAWNFADSIMEAQTAYANGGGHFILPMPVARIV